MGHATVTRLSQRTNPNAHNRRQLTENFRLESLRINVGTEWGGPAHRGMNFVVMKAIGLSIVVSIALLAAIPASAQRIDIDATNKRYQRLKFS